MTRIENEIRTLVASRLHQMTADFRKCNLYPGEIEFIALDEADNHRDSEIRVYFYRNGNIFDALEFHIYRKGKLVSDLDQVAHWLDAVLKDVLERALAKP